MRKNEDYSIKNGEFMLNSIKTEKFEIYYLKSGKINSGSLVEISNN